MAVAGKRRWVRALVVAVLAGAALVAIAPAACAAAGAAAPAAEGTIEENRSPFGERHPGTIHHVDRIRGREWDQPAAEVPPSVAWVQVGEVWKAVVRIEVTGDDQRRCITRFGEGGEFLDTTTQVAPPPPRGGRLPEPVPTPTPTPAPGE